MIENPEFTLKVLKYFAGDDVPFPANADGEELRIREFPDVSSDYFLYHIKCAVELELLDAQCNEISTFDGVIYSLGFISGLTAKGGEYVRNAETKFWGLAMQKLEEKSAAITTSALLECMVGLIASP